MAVEGHPRVSSGHSRPRSSSQTSSSSAQDREDQSRARGVPNPRIPGLLNVAPFGANHGEASRCRFGDFTRPGGVGESS